ncbi:amino acid permease [Colletotrichum higginsianum]|nr:amino acid permease [Colletotrichum higginsianum]
MEAICGTREEHWPEVDVDSDTDEGREAMRRAEIAFQATIERSIRHQHTQSTDDTIPLTLYAKAQSHQDQLTQDERSLLNTRGDVVGKALADPDSLTPDETHQVLFWPPPDVVRANIQRATGGQLSTPSELYAKGKDAVDREQFATLLNEDEIALLARSFHATDDETFSPVDRSNAFGAPGAGHAVELISGRLGLDVVVFRTASLHHMHQMSQMRPTTLGLPSLGLLQSISLRERNSTTPRSHFDQRQPYDIIRAMASLQKEHELGNVTYEQVAVRNREFLAALQASSSRSGVSNSTLSPSSWPMTSPLSPADRFGSGPWPPTVRSRGPIDLFREDTHLSGFSVEPGWSSLSEGQRDTYRIRSDTLRREAWAENETALAAGTSSAVFLS